jgi:hypothetical protein
MAQVMRHKEWMEASYGSKTTIRSGKLKAVDDALLKFDKQPTKQNIQILQGVLVGWMTSKGNAWKSSVRNKNKAVETLFMQINSTGAEFGLNDGLALKRLEEEPKKVIKTLFDGAKIDWKSAYSSQLNSDGTKPRITVSKAVKRAPKQFKMSASTNKFGTALNTGGLISGSSSAHTIRTTGDAGSTSKAISKCISEVVPEAAQNEVMNAVKALVPTFEAQFSAAVMPLAGLIIAGGGTLWNTGNALHKQYGIRDAKKHRERSLAGIGGPDEAIGAMIRILERERNSDVFSAGVSLTEFGGKLAGLAVDGGTASNTAIGLASNVVKLMNIIRIVYRDIREKNAANKAMAQGDVDLSIFETSPLVGCYLICAAPTSVLTNLILDQFGEARWMDNLERNKKRHIEPLQDKARKVIKNHRFEIRSLARAPGMLAVNKEELERMKANVGKTSFARSD